METGGRMEEYTQITLDEWVQLKENLKRDLVGVQESFVRIGYTLRKIEEEKLYEQDGYKNVTEFAKAEYGLNPSAVSRFISINRKYSINGYSDQLRPEFLQMGSSKLSEMLSLPDQDLEMIRPEATREAIRELKQFNREEAESGTADDVRELIGKFFEDNADDLEVLRTSEAYHTGEVDKLIEIVNPGGTRTYKKGLYFLMMYEQEIKVKKFKGSPQTMSWAEFFSIAKEIIENIPIADLEEPMEACVNESGPEAGSKAVIEEEKADSGEDNPVTAASDKNESTVAAGSTDEKEENLQELKDEVNQEKKESREEIAPAQDFVEEEAIEPEEDSSEEGGLESEEDVDGQAERVTERYKTRKEYLDSLSIYRMAHYMKEEYDRKNLQTSMLCYPSQIIDWLTQEVDSQGREIVDV
jgi:hypothetical protein